MSHAIRRAIETMALDPAETPNWGDLPVERRTLAVFAHVMANANVDGLRRIIWRGRERGLGKDERDIAVIYSSCLREIGAEWLGKLVLSLAFGAPDFVRIMWLRTQCARIVDEKDALWQTALRYALANNGLHLKLVR